MSFVSVLLLMTLEMAGKLHSVNITAKYHSFREMEQLLHHLHVKNPDRSFLYSIGHTIKKRDIWVIAIAATDPHKHIPVRPEVKYVANIHGDEAVGRQLLLAFAEYLLTEKNMDQRVRKLLRSSRIHLLPSMNPDSFDPSEEGICDYSMSRFNALKYDLNRNFPDLFFDHGDELQHETKAVINWLRQYPFVLSGSLHGGALVANYPYDNSKGGRTEYSKSPDDDVFRYLASVYASHHRDLSSSHFCDDQPTFPGGITNGAEWYPFAGGMQDYNYVYAGTMELTLELSCCKFPAAAELNKYWKDNVKPMTEFLLQAQRGVKGFIKDENNKGVVATLFIEGRSMGFNSTDLGEYWRILLPGTYKLLINSTRHETVEVPFTVMDKEEPTMCNVTLAGIKTKVSCTNTVPVTQTTQRTERPEQLQPSLIQSQKNLFPLFNPAAEIREDLVITNTSLTTSPTTRHLMPVVQEKSAGENEMLLNVHVLVVSGTLSRLYGSLFLVIASSFLLKTFELLLVTSFMST